MLILRLSRPTSLISAEVFEELFVEQLGSAFDIRRADTGAFCQAVLGPCGSRWSLEDSSARLEAALDGADFVAPDYEAAALAPLLLALRNRAGSATRLLLVAHAPGAWALEWALLSRLLAPGDLVVAPSANAADLIEFFDPALAPFVETIPHPMAPLEPVASIGGEGERIVSLGRLHPAKLLHRQIEALEVLRGRGRRVPILEIAGAAQTPEATVYRASLERKVRRLGLEANVRFVGAIRGREAKAEFLSGAKALVNLSVTIEESFGKAPVEALGCGIPVLGTRWDGLPEAVRECGVLLPVASVDPGVPADVSAASVADGLARLLDAPPPAESCRRQAARFAPSAVVPRYRAALEAAVAARDTFVALGREMPPASSPAAPARGLLAVAAPLTAMSWGDVFSEYLGALDDLRGSWEDDPIEPRVRLGGILLQGTRAPIESFLAGRRPELPAASPSVSTSTEGGELIERVAAAAVRPAAPSTRVACLIYLWQAERLEELRSGISSIDDRTPAVLFLRAEEACMAGDLERAFDCAAQRLDLNGDDGVTAFRLRQLARIARAAATPERALPWLGEWLARFPDSPDSGAVWLDRCINAATTGDGDRASEAAAALEHAKGLLGDSPLLDRVEQMVILAQATAAVGG